MECIVEKEKNELVIVNDGESISVYVDGIDYAWIEKEEYVYAESLDENMTETRFLFDKYGNKVYSAVLESDTVDFYDTEIILDGNILMLDYFSIDKKLLVLIEESRDDGSKKRYINIYDKYRGLVKTVEEPYDIIIPSEIGGYIVNEIRGNIFYRADIDVVEIPGSIKKIKGECFRQSKVKEIIIADGIKEIESGFAFSCQELVAVQINCS
ncbi:MAG: leucine-rich repeat protein [Oscillospiraceae bacterium]|nr:leucine-rich repeat protein [Oscillospiraceae bacterium]